MAKSNEMSDKGLEAVVRKSRFSHAILMSTTVPSLLLGAGTLMAGISQTDRYSKGVILGAGIGVLISGLITPILFRNYLFNSATRPVTNEEAYGIK